MQLLEMQATESTPAVNFDPESGLLSIRGRSIPENALKFYYPIIDWVNEYVKSPSPTTRLDLYLEYLNSISQKMMLELFQAAMKLHRENKNVEVNWFYDEEDDTMREEGRVFSNRFELEFKLRPVSGDEEV